MKKLALILALIVIPCSAFGLEMLNDNAMDQVTGQSGVSIALDDVQLFINIEKMAYIDCDGFNSRNMDYGTCTGAGGAVGMNNFQIDVLNVNAIVASTDQGNGTQTTTNAGSLPLYSTGCGLIPLFYDYGTAGTNGCYLTTSLGNNDGLNNYNSVNVVNAGGFLAKSLSIDVTDALPALSEGLQENYGQATLHVGGVIIGIPTLEIYIDSMILTPFYTGDINGLTSTASNNNATYGTIELQGITFTTLSGWLEIAPH